MLIYTKITASLPFIEVDLNSTLQQMPMLINGLKYIRPCHSRYSGRAIDEILPGQYKNMRTSVEECLNDNRMFKSDQRAQQAFTELERMIRELKFQKVSRKLQ